MASAGTGPLPLQHLKRPIDFSNNVVKGLHEQIIHLKHSARELAEYETRTSEENTFADILSKIITAEADFNEQSEVIKQLHTQLLADARIDQQSRAAVEDQLAEAEDNNADGVINLDKIIAIAAAAADTRPDSQVSASCRAFESQANKLKGKKRPASFLEKNATLRDFKALQGEEPEMEDGDDIAMVAAEKTLDQLKCPLTTSTLQDPVRAPCGHHYSSKAVKQYLRQRSQMQCAHYGCKKSFKESQLKKDPEIAARVKLLLKEKETEKRIRMETQTYQSIE